MPEPIKLDDGNAGSSDKNIPKINLGGPESGSFGMKPTAGSGGMGNIFTQTKSKKEDSKMISSIISQKEVAQKTKSILGPAPTLERSIEQEKEARQKRKLHFYQFVMVLFFIGGFAVAFYFYSQLSPDFTFFGSNVTQNLTDTNSNLRKIQTQINKSNYLAAQVQLNEFSYEADNFINGVAQLNDPTVSSVDKRTIFTNVTESMQTLPTLVSNIRNILTQSIVVPTYHTEAEPDETADQILLDAQTDLKSSLAADAAQYGQNTTAPQDLENLKLIENATQLVGNNAVVNALQKISITDFTNQLTDYSQSPTDQKLQALQAVIGQVLASTKSDLATIASIKNNRIEWSNVITHINDETAMVAGSNFNTPELYDVQGGIVYSGYEFDTSTNEIVLSGTCKTLDGSNFTLMSNLIDQLQNSPYFDNVQMRSFSKSKSGDVGGTGYDTNFKIQLNLVTGSSAKNQSLSLQNSPTQSTASGTPRTSSSVQPSAASSQQLAPAAPETAPLAAPEAPAPGPTLGVTATPPVAPAAPAFAPSTSTQDQSSAAASSAPVTPPDNTQASAPS